VNWVCSERLDPKFLQYLLIAEGPSLSRFSSGAVHQTIYYPEVKAFYICHPRLAEQRRIVAILNETIAGIARAVAATEKNLANARELFESHLNTVFIDTSLRWTKKRLSVLVDRITNGYVGPTRDIYLDQGVPYLLARASRPR
jgi:type I restriction enzyme S subunit